MLPGTALAVIFLGLPITEAIGPTLIGIAATCLVASANYVINEYLDRDFDRHHPLKKHRPSAIGNIRARYMLIEYVVLAAGGLTIAASINHEFLIWSAILLVMGVIYNVRPFRSKDRIYIDVLSESVNNPLRFLLGWSAIAEGAFPPSSILIAYWMGGAFLMGIKRYAEYNFIDDPERAGMYRRSFQSYDSEKLLLSSLFYALTSVFFLGFFLVKYRIEFLLSFPLFALLFVWYLHLGMKKDSVAQRPEQMYRERGFIAYIIFLGAAVTLLFFVDIPWLHWAMDVTQY
jgi:4-hydroxybenzoate polyprenyltransferase